jgi:hypothetical protein
MKDYLYFRLSFRAASAFIMSSALVACLSISGVADAAAPGVDVDDLTKSGFKALAATTPLQKEWIKRLPPGEIRPVQKNEKKYFIYPDAANGQIYAGGTNEYKAYKELHPDSKLATAEAAKKGAEYRVGQTDVMQKATARDLSDPFLGVSWMDLMYY